VSHSEFELFSANFIHVARGSKILVEVQRLIVRNDGHCDAEAAPIFMPPATEVSGLYGVITGPIVWQPMEMGREGK
jgi:hypothetical protein